MKKFIDYTNKELLELQKIKDELIIWMYHNPNDSYPIIAQLKKAFQLGFNHKEIGEEKQDE
jgi:hypothetical protein